MKANFKNNAPALVLLLGAGLATIQFLSGRSVWMDEAKLALNIINRSYTQLLEPLDSVQVAPILFLWTERFLIDVFGAGDLIFRSIPLIGFLVACYVFYRLLKLWRFRTNMALVAASLFAFCQPLIYYASDIKQYSTDVCVALVLTCLVLKSYKTDKLKIIVLVIAGVLAIGFSNISVILLFVLGIYLWGKTYSKTKRVFNYSLIPIGIWVMAFLGYYAAFIYNHPTPDYMADYWSDFAYMPLNPFSVPFWEFWQRSYVVIFGKIMGVNPKIPYLFNVYGIAWLLGVIAFYKDKRFGILFIVLGPFIVHIALSAFQLYPFVQRVGLYLQPFFAIVCARGFVFVVQKIIDITKVRELKYSLFLPGLVVLGITLVTFPKKREEFKESFEYMLSRKRTQDKLFTNSGVDNTWYYYEKTGYIPDTINRIISGYHRDDFSEHNAQLDTLNGRVWFLQSHDYYDSQTFKMLESDYILEQLRKRGTVLDEFKTVGSSVYLFELSK